MPRLIGLDFGEKRIGVAITDPLQLIAQPHGTYHQAELWSVLTKMVQEEPGVEAFVVGWPLQEDGSEGAATFRVATFIQQLSEKFADIPIHKIDERYTSEMAIESIRASGLRMKARREKSRVDRTAAAILLRDFMELR
ncbi:MAG: Holliday junction resolvase RuvX [Bacteroidetes Order II. Incertae sedis bacterium]|nr:Holliday junction resolvase RuvX [Bacteroidetes Order II. bacterium]